MAKSAAFRTHQFSFRTKLKKFVPIVGWLPKYTKSDVISDFIAGFTVGLTMMPQAIAYANLAGLPAQYGLYTAFIGSFTYVFFGTIKEVSIGPTSLMALLTLSFVEGLPVDFVVLLTLIVGCVEFLMGVLNLGFLVDFISPCVTSGFTSAMTIVITASQLKYLFGLRKLDNHGFFDVLKQICLRYDEIKFGDTTLGLISIAFLLTFKQLPKVKTSNEIVKKTLWFLSISRNAMIVLITSTYAFYLHEFKGGAPFVLSGAVPQGLPHVAPPHFSVTIGNSTLGVVDMVNTLGSGIFVIPVAAVLANVAIAKAFSSGAVVDAGQEMLTLGLCNIFGSFVQAMPSCGAFTRSAVASSSGVRTPLQGIYSGTIIILALSFLTPYFFYIPRPTLAAVLIAAIISMFDYAIFPKLWKTSKFDFVLTLSTLVIGVLYGVENGIIAGGLMNLIILLKIWNKPNIVKEIRSNGQGNYIYFRPEVGLYYPAIDYLSTEIAKVHRNSPHLPITIDCSDILRVDYAGCQLFQNLTQTYNKNHRVIDFVNIKPEIYKVLQYHVDLTNKSPNDSVEIPLLEK